MKRKLYHMAMWAIMYTSTALIGGILTGIVGVILWRGMPHLTLSLLTSEESILHGTVGIFPSLCNTLLVIVMTLGIALPLGVGAAVYLTEYASHPALVALIEFATETLAGIPSILYAMVGVIVFCSGWGKTLLSGALTLAMMVLPTIIRTTQESLKAVPSSYREGAFALGAGKWRSIATVILPCANSGILTGCVLSVGRVVGETAVLLYTAGLSTAMQDFSFPDIIRASGTTLSTALYLYARERADMDTAFAIAVLLLLVIIAVNLAVGLLSRKHHR